MELAIGMEDGVDALSGDAEGGGKLRGDTTGPGGAEESNEAIYS